jgi:tetratricopeptide (TPR) repeat protein
MSKVTSDDLERNFYLLRSDPEKYLAMAEELVRSDPTSPDGYWSRHLAHEKLQRYDLALADLNKVLSIEQKWILYESRGNVLCASAVTARHWTISIARKKSIRTIGRRLRSSLSRRLLRPIRERKGCIRGLRRLA